MVATAWRPPQATGWKIPFDALEDAGIELLQRQGGVAVWLSGLATPGLVLPHELRRLHALSRHRRRTTAPACGSVKFRSEARKSGESRDV